MSSPVAAAGHFAQLVHLAIHQRPDAELVEPLHALLDTMAQLNDSGVDLSSDGVVLRANRDDVPNSFVGVSDLVAQCHAHGLSSLYIARDTHEDELLLVAQAIATEAPAVQTEAEAAFRGRIIGVDRVIPTFSQIPKVLPRPTRSLTPEDWGRVIVQDNATSSLPFAAVRRPTMTVNELFVKVLANPPKDQLVGLLEQLFILLGDAVRDDNRRVVLELFEFIADRGDRERHFEIQELYQHYERRMIRPLTLEPLCKQVLAGGDIARRAIDIARRIGAPAVTEMLEMLTATDSRKERSAIFNALLTMRIEAGFLRHLMHDQRWFVARNAVDLAGKGARRELEDDVIEMTEHLDERVKLAALHGLARIGTPKAMVVLTNALRDPSPAVRAKAAAALGSLRRTIALPMVSEALQRERDTSVITALKVALGIHSRAASDVPNPHVDERRSVERQLLRA